MRASYFRFGWLILWVAALLLAACSKPPVQPAGQSATVPQVSTSARSTDDKLMLKSATGSMYQGRLALTLTFSQRLAGTQDFDRLLTVKDAKGALINGAWTLGDQGLVLRFPSVQANVHYHVQVDRTLTAAGGNTLQHRIDKDVYSGPLEPSVGFASRGSVLPARQARGLPVVSVNVDQVDVEFMRVHDDALSDFFAAYTHNGQRTGWDLDPRYGWGNRKGRPLTEIADSVYSNRFVLDTKPNQRSVTYLPIQNIRQLDKPGLYFAVMRRAGSFRDRYATSYFFVSDIGLHTRAYKDQLFVHTASLESGKPLVGVKLSVLGTLGNARVTATTNAKGDALMGYRLKSSDVLVARLDHDVSMLPFNQPALDLSAFDVAGRRQTPFDVFAWSGRDLYRPGETLHLSALLRNYDGQPMPRQPMFVTLKQPDGRDYASARLTPEDLNYFDFSQMIPADAPTGRWQVEFRLDPTSKQATQSMSFHVEDFLPERLKLHLDTARDILTPGMPLTLAVQSDYLYGAPAAGNRFTAKLTLAAEQHPIDALKDYYFGDPTLDLPRQARDVIDAKLDAKGSLSQKIDVFEGKSPASPVSAFVSGSVYETGGRTVTRTIKRTLWPADVLVGIHPLFSNKDGADPDAQAGFELIRANAAGQLLAGKGLKVVLVREYRDAHWTWSDSQGWSYDYTSRFEDVETRTLDTVKGQATRFNLPVEWGNYRLRITDPATGLVMRYPFFAGWNWNDQNRGTEARPDKVKLALDKPAYRAGDTLKVTVTAPQAGPGVLLVESDHLLYSRDIDAKPGSTFAIPVTKDWARHDVYVTVLVFRGGSAKQHSTPARAVGEVFVPIERGRRRIALTVKAPEQMRPHNVMRVDVTAPALAGHEAYVYVSAVDVGVLNITRFKLPDPFAWFFSQRALGIDAYDLYGRVIEGFEGGTARLAYGGDMALAALPQARRPTSEQKTVDLFAGPVALDAAGHAAVALKVPEFNGTARVTAVAWSADSYGSADTTTLIRAPLVLEPSTPRVLAPGDQSELSLDVTNFSGEARDIAVTVKTQGPVSVGGGVRHLHLDEGARTTLDLPLQAHEGYGTAHITVTASAGKLQVQSHHSLIVRAAWPAVTRSSVQVLDTLAPIHMDASLTRGLVANSVTARLTLTRLPPLPFARALTQLSAYPYSCLEQIISRGWGALLLDDKLAAALHVPAPGADVRRRRVQQALARLASLQIPSGHFSMWGGDSGQAATFLTPYAVDFMLDARDAGFAVDDQVLQKALKRLSDDLLTGGHYYYGYEHADHLRFADQAYSGYVLARVNRAPLGTLRVLYDQDRGKSLTALPLVHLGLALKLMGDAPRGTEAINQAFSMQVKRPWYLGDYGSNLRDMALMVTLLHKYDMDKPAYDARLIAVARDDANAHRTASRWGSWNYLSTQEEAALGRLAAQLLKGSQAPVEGEIAGELAGELKVGNERTPIHADALWSRSFDADALQAGVTVTPKGSPPLYVISDAAGIPTLPPVADDSEVSVSRDYFTLDGKPWDGKPLVEGQMLIARVRLQARKNIADALFTDLLPGGLELENMNLTDASQWAKVVIDGVRLNDRGRAAKLLHEEFRDDRYVAALHLNQGQKAQVFYLVRAVSPGTFTVPPPILQDMYRPQVRGVGVSSPADIKVIEPNAVVPAPSQ